MYTGSSSAIVIGGIQANDPQWVMPGLGAVQCVLQLPRPRGGRGGGGGHRHTWAGMIPWCCHHYTYCKKYIYTTTVLVLLCIIIIIGGRYTKEEKPRVGVRGERYKQKKTSRVNAHTMYRRKSGDDVW